MTRDQIKKVSKEGARKAADPKSGKPVSAKHIQRLADLKLKRANAKSVPVQHQEREEGVSPPECSFREDAISTSSAQELLQSRIW